MAQSGKTGVKSRQTWWEKLYRAICEDRPLRAVRTQTYSASDALGHERRSGAALVGVLFLTICRDEAGLGGCRGRRWGLRCYEPNSTMHYMLLSREIGTQGQNTLDRTLKMEYDCQMLHQMPRFTYKIGYIYKDRNFVMSILTRKQAWYQANREKVIEQARQWRLKHPERYREVQKAAKRRKRKALMAPLEPKKWWETSAPAFPPAPEGYDPACGETVENWCLQHNISRDPSTW